MLDLEENGHSLTVYYECTETATRLQIRVRPHNSSATDNANKNENLPTIQTLTKLTRTPTRLLVHNRHKTDSAFVLHKLHTLARVRHAWLSRTSLRLLPFPRENYVSSGDIQAEKVCLRVHMRGRSAGRGEGALFGQTIVKGRYVSLLCFDDMLIHPFYVFVLATKNKTFSSWEMKALWRVKLCKYSRFTQLANSPRTEPSSDQGTCVWTENKVKGGQLLIPIC